MKSIIDFSFKRFFYVLLSQLFFTLPLWTFGALLFGKIFEKNQPFSPLFYALSGLLLFNFGLISFIFSLIDIKTWRLEGGLLQVYHLGFWKKTFVLADLKTYYLLGVRASREQGAKAYQILHLHFFEGRKGRTISFSSKDFKNFDELLKFIEKYNPKEDAKLADKSSYLFLFLLGSVVLLMIFLAILRWLS
ncbi:hypothetical protein [Hugenholtzia roseola]|uniref:hypothetical protein n=1 Tax=Hugenholtzia roseola TaxID=1002 RepID=UPI000403C8B3|nr:hypothetical protein [Hugenholtzia roseola]